jgi:hypothetical protein
LLHEDGQGLSGRRSGVRVQVCHTGILLLGTEIIFLFKARFADPKTRNKLRDSKNYVATVDFWTAICTVSFGNKFVGQSYEVSDICTGTTQIKSVGSGADSGGREFQIP